MVEGVGDEGGREGEGTLERALGHVGDGLGGPWEARGGVSAHFREVWGWGNGGTVSLVEKIGINLTSVPCTLALYTVLLPLVVIFRVLDPWCRHGRLRSPRVVL